MEGYQHAQVSLLGTRKINQDRCAIFRAGDNLLLALADGLGGHPRGEVAAQILLDSAEELFHHIHFAAGNAESFLQSIFNETHDRIQAFGQGQQPPLTPRTTGVLVLVQRGQASWMHIGDSRLYAFRQGRLLFRTRDHSFVEKMRAEGLLNEAEALHHPKRHYLTLSIGGPGVCPKGQFGEGLRLLPGDLLVASTDGFWGHLEEQEIASSLSADLPLRSHLEHLARQAERRAGTRCDNITALALRWIARPGAHPSNTVSGKRPAPREFTRDERLNRAVEQLKEALAEVEKDFE